MSGQRILGVMMLVAGVILLIMGLNATESVSETVNEAFTGTFSDQTIWYLIGGAVLAVGGLLLALSGGRAVR